MTGFFDLPFAHRGLQGDGVSENSLEAIRAAADAGYAVELDVQLTADGHAIAFHDYELERLTGQAGRVREKTLAEMAALPLLKGGTIPLLADALATIGGRTPVTVEIKDQDGAYGHDIGPLEAATAAAIGGYDGPVAVMSFNPYSVAWMKDNAPGVRRGVVSYDYADEDLPPALRTRLATLVDFDAIGAQFVSYGAKSLPSTAVADLRARGVPTLCWTIRSPGEAAAALLHVDQITFEGFRPPRDAR